MSNRWPVSLKFLHSRLLLEPGENILLNSLGEASSSLRRAPKAELMMKKKKALRLRLRLRREQLRCGSRRRRQQFVSKPLVE